MRLSPEARAKFHLVSKKQSESSQKLQREQILLKADADGPRWTDEKFGEAFGWWGQTIEKRERLVTEVFKAVLHGNHSHVHYKRKE